jgi:hypothetical protein
VELRTEVSVLGKCMTMPPKILPYKSLAAGSGRETLTMLCVVDTSSFACFTELEDEFAGRLVIVGHMEVLACAKSSGR